jgi:hypothetical protein
MSMVFLLALFSATGQMVAQLLDEKKNVLFTFSQSLALASPTDTSVVELPNSDKDGSIVSIWRDPDLFPGQNPLCEDMRWGCNHKLDTSFNKVILKDCCSFLVPPPPNILGNLFAGFNAQLYLKVYFFLPDFVASGRHPNVEFVFVLFSQVTSLTVTTRAGVTKPPEVFLGFQQLTLSTLQNRGVAYMITGFAIMFLSLALTLFHVFFQVPCHCHVLVFEISFTCSFLFNVS